MVDLLAPPPEDRREGAADYIPHPAVADFGVNLGKYGPKNARKQAKILENLPKINAVFR